MSAFGNANSEILNTAGEHVFYLVILFCNFFIQPCVWFRLFGWHNVLLFFFACRNNWFYIVFIQAYWIGFLYNVVFGAISDRVVLYINVFTISVWWMLLIRVYALYLYLIHYIFRIILSAKRYPNQYSPMRRNHIVYVFLAVLICISLLFIFPIRTNSQQQWKWKSISTVQSRAHRLAPDE